MANQKLKIPAAWLIPFGVHVYSTTFSAHYDKTSPRTYVQVMDKDKTIDQAVSFRPTKPISLTIPRAKTVSFELTALNKMDLKALASSLQQLLLAISLDFQRDNCMD